MAKNNITNFNDNFCFDFRSGNVSVKQQACQYFDDHKVEADKWWEASSKIPLFLDTNVLLEAYNYPKEIRKIFVNFLKQNHNRIYITDQVDEEFQRKRLNFIGNYNEKISKLLKDFESFVNDSNITTLCSKLVLRLDNLKKNSIVRTDFSKYVQNLEDSIERIREWSIAMSEPCRALSVDLHDRLASLQNSLKEELKNLADDTDIVSAVATCTFCTKTTAIEKEYIIKLYQKCLDERERMKNRPDNIDLQLYIFPGFGDLGKEKVGKQREGDFILYHEMLRKIKELKRNVVFITSDIKKNDNTPGDGNPYPHYICNCYSLTGHVYYLVDGKSIPLATMQPSLVDSDSDGEEDIDTQRLQEDIRDEKSTREHNPFFKTITKDIFMKNLSICASWANDYGDKYVGKDYFIYGILGHKRHKFSESMDLLQNLVNEGVLDIVKNKAGIECIVIK